MIKQIDFSEKAKQDLKEHQKSGKKIILKRIFKLLASMKETPYQGIGKPEGLKHELVGLWSRRINREHRIIYQVLEEEELIEIYSLKGHYQNL